MKEADQYAADVMADIAESWRKRLPLAEINQYAIGKALKQELADAYAAGYTAALLGQFEEKRGK